MRSPIWLALHLPSLALEALAPVRSPSAVVWRDRIFVADAAAQQAGIRAGVGVAAARALSPALTTLGRDPAREQAALRMLACWAGRFTPRVSLAEDTVLLEVAACLRLFGGLRRLVGTLDEASGELGFSLALAAAPTPLAAQWLACCARAVFCSDPARLPAHLAPLPVAVLPARAAQALREFGVTTLGEARRLPAAALARRVGAETLQQLARAFGELPDPRADFAFPERFDLSLPLPAAVETAGALVFAARRLTAALAGWLAARRAGVHVAMLRLQHAAGETPVPLRFAEATADGARFERVLRERLDRMQLDAPVEALCLQATEVVALAPRSRALFHAGAGTEDAASVGELLERLSARLGAANVYRVSVQDEHRPEWASTRREWHRAPALAPAPAPGLPRPLWLLEVPEALREVDGRPFRGGPLALLHGPERIESGWWRSEVTVEPESGPDAAAAGGDAQRDYFVAQDRQARRLWIYRACRAPGGWFLHGVFA